ncbi:MAG: preprotein translocase subunit SecE [Candidatus Woykebacteria bacterium RIFCSPHIGHO2_01_FULL_39_12]|uniref:Protein translocase subunit SecE n=1 Tax=Candidatus Woykebacteria bacterium RIFCSPHIGHO2_01_FULL_39_12 TaxID=1802599 RepID=A0A1G1WH75_9BACT|nr:MAG: preprotein translocase subunit SecE [Candidatus Woykebacteria bacterium RIFCSPHIGHO2_01_FULL_39_12]
MINFLKEVQEEMGKVTWPTRNQTIKMSLLVVAVSIIFGVFLGALDFLLTKALTIIIEK